MDSTYDEMLTILEKHTSSIHTPLDDLQAVRGNDLFRTLIQTILTAQTKDSTTAPVSRRLFKALGDKPDDIASASISSIIKSSLNSVIPRFTFLTITCSKLPASNLNILKSSR